MIFQINRFLLCLMLVMLLASITPIQLAFADQPPVVELPPIKVTAQRSKWRTPGQLSMITGVDIIIENYQLMTRPDITIEDVLGDADVNLLRCQEIRADRPQNCGFNLSGTLIFNMPSVPGFDPNWSGNGCGTGGGVNAVLEFFTPSLHPDFNELNEPYQGVNFLDACNAHDRCFASSGTSFGGCNDAFFEAMNQACGGISRCEDFASLYRAGVATNVGRWAYDSAQAKVSCAEWHDLMEINNCPDDLGQMP